MGPLWGLSWTNLPSVAILSLAFSTMTKQNICLGFIWSKFTWVIPLYVRLCASSECENVSMLWSFLPLATSFSDATACVTVNTSLSTTFRSYDLRAIALSAGILAAGEFVSIVFNINFQLFLTNFTPAYVFFVCAILSHVKTFLKCGMVWVPREIH